MTEEPSPGISRRQALRGALGIGVSISTAGLLGACDSGSGSTTSASGTPAAVPKLRRGGQLRLGATGGGATDSLDAHISKTTDPDSARLNQLYESLAKRDDDFRLKMVLAESIEPESDGQVWTIRLREGVEFHNGKTAGADDVIFSLRRIIESEGAVGASGLAYVDPKGMKKLDKRTVRLTLKKPTSTLVDDLGLYVCGMVPVGYDPKKPVGTGPFKLKSFTPGERSVFVRHDNYWRGNEPYLDEVVVINFADDAPRFNALNSGQVDCISNVPPAQLTAIEETPSLKPLVAPTGSFQPFVMRTDVKPFDDVRVRQAFKLIVDRQQLVDQALSGQGRVANDVPCPFDSAHNKDLEQREPDIDRAKSLLKAAGQEGLTVELTTAPVAQGVVEAAQVLAQQASAAGVKVEVRKVDSSTFFGPNFLKWPFSQDYWTTHPYLAQVALSSLPTSPYNETHFDDPEFKKLIAQASRELDEGKRDELLQEAQRIEWERGGYIVWSFSNQIDAHSSKVGGFKPAKTGIPLGNYELGRVGFVE